MTPAERHLLAALVATVRTIARTPEDRPCVQAAAARLDAAAEAVDAEARGPDIVDMLADLALASDGYLSGHVVEARWRALREAVTRARMARANAAMLESAGPTPAAEGFAAYGCGIALEDNPYGSREPLSRKEWEAGWIEAADLHRREAQAAKLDHSQTEAQPDRLARFRQSIVEIIQGDGGECELMADARWACDEIERLRAAVALAASNAQAIVDQAAWLDGNVAFFAGEPDSAIPDCDCQPGWEVSCALTSCNRRRRLGLVRQVPAIPAGDLPQDAAPLAPTDCRCHRCHAARVPQQIPGPSQPGWRYACEICGNKRCPHHKWHGFGCTGSNAAGQVGVEAPGPIGTVTPDKPMVPQPHDETVERARAALVADVRRATDRMAEWGHAGPVSVAGGVSGPGRPGVAGGAQGAVEPSHGPDGWRYWETDPPPERVAIEVRRDGLLLWRAVGEDAADGSGEVEQL